MFPLKRYFLFWLIMMSQQMFCQLNDFNFSVSTTDETCAGNGSISMMVSGTTPNSTLTYTLYLYPDTGTPLAQTSTNTFNNLDSGTYLVIALQTLGNLQNSQSADATVNDATIALDFEIGQAFMGNCDAASLIMTVLSGNAVSYEILSGPVTAPPQSSNTFDDLPEGTYVIRVYDNCNNALTKTFTLILDTDAYMLGPVSLPTIFENCDEITITNTITAENQGELAYPISINYTVLPPDGSPPISFSHTYNSGPESQLSATETIEVYDEQVFNIEIVAEDNCGRIVTIVNEIDPNPKVAISTSPGFCGMNLKIQVTRFMPPYTLEFTQAPSGFDPAAYNPDFPGPFTSANTTFLQEDSGVPYGSYSVVIVDACGRTGTDTFEVEEEPIEPEVASTNNGCNPLFGLVTVSIPDREIVSAIFTDVPEDYAETPPIDISNSITTGGILVVEDLPQGDYSLEMIDNCGNEYLVEFTIPEFTGLPLSIHTTPNCTTQTGTLRIASPYGDVESVIITEAPPTFQETLPYDYSAQILAIGIFYVGNLPEGTYTIEFSDSCGNEFVITRVINAYQSDASIYNLQRNCGSFNLGIADTDESVWDQTYWFQKYFPNSNTWGHPYTGTSYIEGEMPNSTNAIEIENEETIYNIFLTGTFRLIKAFQPFNNPNPNQRCYDSFAEFEVSEDLIIKGVYNLNCEGGTGPSDILVDVIGVEPYNFSIVSPISIDNGSNNIFTNLSPGTYEIKVEDICGSIENIIVNLEDLLPVVNIATPTDLVMCSDISNNQAVFDLSQQNTQILGTQNPDNFTITYHINQEDADSGENPLPDIYENNASPQTIYVRVIHNTLQICYETTSFQLIVSTFPQLGPDETISMCDGSSVTLSAIPGFTSYLWSNGETTPSISISNSGNYSVTVSENYNDFYCDATKTFVVEVSGTATIENITLVDFSSTNNSISVEVSGLGDYEYSLDGTNFQNENYFSNLQSGEYTVYVRDKNGCGVVTQEVYLLNYMKFFTPNGDGENEYWQISGSQFEPNLEINIFDRYGKLLTSFKGHDRGWDGIYNGQNMPTNDYWFVVKRGNSKTYKGHFTLKR